MLSVYSMRNKFSPLTNFQAMLENVMHKFQKCDVPVSTKKTQALCYRIE